MRSKRKQKAKYRDSIVLAIIKFPFEHPLLFFLIVIIILSGWGLINRRQTTNKLSVKTNNSHGSILGLIETRCRTQPFKVANKLPNLQVALIDNRFHPAICARDRKINGTFGADCKSLIGKREQFMQSKTIAQAEVIVQEARARVKKQLAGELEATNARFNRILQALNPVQKLRFENIDTTLILLRHSQLLSAEAKRIKQGACGEHSFSALYDLVVLSRQQDTELKLNFVGVDKNDGQSHSFINIYGQGDNIEIKNNRVQTRDYLRKMGGYLCDPWNEGYFLKTNENDNQLYTEWDSVRSEVIDFESQDLPSAARQYIDERLAVLQLPAINGSSLHLRCN